VSNSGWIETTLGEVAEFEMGQAPPGSECNKDGNGTVFVKAGEFSTLFPLEREWTTKPLKYGKKGDVFICVVGATSGKLNLGIDCAIGRSVAAIRPKEGTDTRFIYYQLLPWVLKLRASSSGSAQGVISKKQLNEVPIKFAPSEQQKRIVAEIEKQFSRLDEAVANLKRVKANLKRYKAAVLKAAVEGKLTEEWRKQHTDVEPADKLLERILEERRSKWGEAELAKMEDKGKAPKNNKWKGKYKEAELPKKEDTFELPSTWAWTNIGQLSWSVKDGPHYSPKYSESGIPFVSGGNIRPEGIDFEKTKFISHELHEKLSERCKPELGDLLYTKGGTTGIARINTETREFNVWVHVAVLRLVDSIEKFYLQHCLNSMHCYRQSQRYTHGVGNQDLGLTRMIWITVLYVVRPFGTP
jgi:type I restriction enzyme S subunit